MLDKAEVLSVKLDISGATELLMAADEVRSSVLGLGFRVQGSGFRG